MADLTHAQRVERMVFASTHAYTKARAKNQIKNVHRKARKAR